MRANPFATFDWFHLMRVTLQPAYILHHRPYRDTSALLELWTHDFGRIGMVARGARAVGSQLRGILQPFRPLLVSWTGKGELKTLTGAEGSGLVPALSGRALLSGFYLNELLLRMVQRQDPHAELFDAYEAALQGLAHAGQEERALRIFERDLLQALGYGLVLDAEAGTGRAVEPAREYRYQLEKGVVPADAAGQGGIRTSGRSLLSLARSELRDAESLGDAKRLMRAALAFYLGDRPLKSRELFAALVAQGSNPEPESDDGI